MLILEIALSTLFEISLLATKECAEPVPCPSPLTNRLYEVELTGPSADTLNKVTRVEWHSRHAAIDPIGKGLRAAIEGTAPGDVEVDATITIDAGTVRRVVTDRTVFPLSFTTQAIFPFRAAPLADVTRVALQRASIRPAHERGLWTLIRANTRAIGFHHYHEFINRVLCHHAGSRAFEVSHLR